MAPQRTQQADQVRQAVVIYPGLGITHMGVMPRDITDISAAGGGYTVIEPPFPLRDFTVSLQWSKRFEADCGNRWLRGVIEDLFRE